MDLGDSIKEDLRPYVATMDCMLEAIKEYTSVATGPDPRGRFRSPTPLGQERSSAEVAFPKGRKATGRPKAGPKIGRRRD
jgi:hypothetical protein